MTSVRHRLREGVDLERLATEARRSSRSVLVLVISAVIGLVSLALVLRNLDMQWPWKGYEVLRVEVANASGVVAGKQQVRVAGIPAGRITQSRLVDGRAVLTLKIDEDYGPIYRDARVVLRPQTPLQDNFVDIVDRGTPRAGRLGDRILPATQTRTSVQAGEVLDAFDADTRQRLGILIDELGAGLDDGGAQLRTAFGEVAPFLRAVQRLTHETASRQAITRRLVHNLSLLTAALGARDRQLTTLVRAGSATVRQTAATERQLGDLIRTLPPTMTQLRRSFATIRSTLPRLDPALEALRPAAAELAPGLDALEALARRAEPTLRALDEPVTALRPLARHLTPTARGLQRAVTTLAPQAAAINRVTDMVAGCGYALGKFFQWTPSLLKFYDSRGVIPRSEGTGGAETALGVVRTPNLKAGASCTGTELPK